MLHLIFVLYVITSLISKDLMVKDQAIYHDMYLVGSLRKVNLIYSRYYEEDMQAFLKPVAGYHCGNFMANMYM